MNPYDEELVKQLTEWAEVEEGSIYYRSDLLNEAAARIRALASVAEQADLLVTHPENKVMASIGGKFYLRMLQQSLTRLKEMENQDA